MYVHYKQVKSKMDNASKYKADVVEDEVGKVDLILEELVRC